MFESADLGHVIPKSRYKIEVPRLRANLLDVQYRLLANPKFPVLILVNGVDGAGKGETVNLFNEWMDPRHIRTEAFGPTNGHDGGRPDMWRFWQALPPRGRIGILFGSWYTDPIVNRATGADSRSRFTHHLEQIRAFERMLVAEGVLILKLWFHLSKDAQRKRLEDLGDNPRTSWRVTDQDWERFKQYDRFRKVSADAVRETSTGEAPWHIIDGSDPYYRALTAGNLVLDAMNHRLAGEQPVLSPATPPPDPSLDGRDLINSLDYKLKLTSKQYARQLEKAQGRLNLLTRHKRMKNHSLVLVFEGMDAAGKGSAIRRATRALDARFYRVVPIAAPTDEERAQPYLWRFWRHIPRRGNAVIFDRSWYGRVLVERVEGYCSEPDWMRAYHEINGFEDELYNSGAIVVKFWLSITLKEQLARFHEREKTVHKRFKITEDDWRNRDKWPQYEQAVCDMVERTSNAHAPWHLIPANDKLYARIEVLERICDAIEDRLG